MKLSSIPVTLAAVVGLVGAAPIRILVEISREPTPQDAVAWGQHIRWGHAAAPALNSYLGPLEAWAMPTPTAPIPTAATPTAQAWIPTPTAPTWMTYPPFAPYQAATRFPTGTLYPMGTPYLMNGRYNPYYGTSRPTMPMRKGGCRGGMRAKSMQISNKLRVLLGLPPIDYFPRPHRGAPGILMVEALPMVVPTHYRHHMRPQRDHAPFSVRLSHSLAMLGPWEGRAVSFVLGCGVGVLLRMIFVFSVLIVRSLRARRQERQLVLDEDSVIFVAEDAKQPVIVETLPEYAEKTEETPQANNAH